MFYKVVFIIFPRDDSGARRNYTRNNLKMFNQLILFKRYSVLITTTLSTACRFLLRFSITRRPLNESNKIELYRLLPNQRTVLRHYYFNKHIETFNYFCLRLFWLFRLRFVNVRRYTDVQLTRYTQYNNKINACWQ